MRTVLIIHGTGGNSRGNWFPWLKKELKKKGCKVFVPDFPTPKNQSLKNWLLILKKYELYIDENTIFIGHSLGPAFILKFLQKTDKKIHAAYLVAGFTKNLGNKYFDDLNKTFIQKKFDWEQIRKNSEKFHIINSDNDPYVPLSEGKLLAKNLKTKLIVVKKGGHLNKEFGYTKFKLLLNKIKKEL